MVVNRARIISTNLVDDSLTLESTPTALTTLPIENIRSPLRSRVARIPTDIDTVQITGNTDVSSVGGFALQGHNLSGSAQFRIELFSDLDQTGTPIHDTGLIQAGSIAPWGSFLWGQPWGDISGQRKRNILIYWFQGVVHSGVRSFRLTFVDASLDFIDLGRIYMGAIFSPLISFPEGFGFAWEDMSIQTRTESGALTSDRYANYRKIQFAFNRMRESERQQFSELVFKHGKVIDFFVSLFPDEGNSERELDYSMGCKFVQIPKVVGNLIDAYSTTIDVEET